MPAPIPFLGPVIIGGLTTLVGNIFVNRQDQIKRQREFDAAELAMANKVFDEVSVAMATVAESSRNVMWALVLRPDRNADEDVAVPDRKQWFPEDKQSWDTYSKMSVSWNNSRARNLALTKKYFGEEAADKLSHIQKELEKLERCVEATYFGRPTSRHYMGNKEDAKEKYLPTSDRLLQEPGLIRELTEVMIDKIQKREVGALTTTNV